jgi:phosphate ABC transporter permease protein PstC
MAAEPVRRVADRPSLGRSASARLPDQLLKWVLTGLAGGVILLIGYFFVSLYLDAHKAFSAFGYFGFAFRNNWDPSHLVFSAGALMVGTIITSIIALVIGVPVAVAIALFTTELCPRRLRSILTLLVELLAAVPSIVYGLWGIFFLIPRLRGPEQWVADTFSFLPFVGGHVAGPNYFIAGLVLAIMIVPIVSAISREVLATVPPDQKSAAYALGATRWEMIRLAVLPYARAGITGAALLGLGRAIGETIAVTLVIGDAPRIGNQLFDQGYTLAAVIANEFGEAASVPLHRASLIAAGLVLFVLTLVVNAIARYLVVRSERAGQSRVKASRSAA